MSIASIILINAGLFAAFYGIGFAIRRWVDRRRRQQRSDDNAFSEALFKTLKYRPWYPDGPFQSIDAAADWVENFVRWYNTEHLHSGIKFVTPEDRHQRRDVLILEKRKAVYELARGQTPKRWSAAIKNWEYVEVVALNALKQPENDFMNNFA